MKTKYFLFNFIVLILLAHTGYAESRSGGVSGKVIDGGNLPLVGASIQIKSISKTVIADRNGEYVMQGIQPGDYILTVTYIGFRNIEQKITIKSNQLTSLDLKMEDSYVLDNVEVKGTTGGTLKALNQQKNSTRIMNVISADQVGAFPDPNIGDALKRVAGVHVQYDQGEAKLVSIRGTDPSSSTFSINGAAMPGTGDNRAVGVDAIPADMVQAIELSKTLTPDMDGDAIGGAINLVTRKAPYSRRFSFTGATGYSVLTSEPQFNANLIYGERFINNKLGVIGSASIYKQSLGSNLHGSSWEKTNVGSEEYFVPKYLEIEQTIMQRLRQSYTLGLDFDINEKNAINFTGIYNDYKDWRKRYTLLIDDIGGGYKENWLKASGFEGVSIFNNEADYSKSSSSLKVLDADNDGVDDVTGKTFVSYNPENPTFYPELERHVYAGANKNGGELTHTKILNGALDGKHIFNKITIDWKAAIIATSADQPGLRDFELQSSNEKTVQMDYTNPRFINASSGFTLDNLDQLIAGKNSDEVSKVDTWELDGFKGKIGKSSANQQLYMVNFELPLKEGFYQNILKFGGKAKLMTKKKEIIGRVKWHPAQDPNMPEGTKNWSWMWNDFAQNMKDVSSQFNNSKYSVGQSVDANWVANQNVNPFAATSDWQLQTIYNNEMADGYSATEDVLAAYIMSTQQIGDKMSLIAGLRAEQTNVIYKGTEYTERADVTQAVRASTSYLSLLPSFHVRYTPTVNSVVRFAYSRTISRPDYRDLVPYTKSNVKNATLKFGNPDIKPTLSNNLDLLGELYLGSIGLVSGGVYFKNIKDFRTIQNWEMPWEEVEGRIPSIDEVAANPNADPKNVENYKKDFDKVKGKPFLSQMPMNGGNANLVGVEIAFQRNLGFIGHSFRYLNLYSNYTHNWVKSAAGSSKMVGTADDVFNLSLSFENKKLNARVSYNYTSDFLINTGVSKEYDAYYDDVSYLDANVDYFLSSKVTLFASANNLLNEVQREYQWSSEYTKSSLENGARVQLGVKFNPFK